MNEKERREYKDKSLRYDTRKAVERFCKEKRY